MLSQIKGTYVVECDHCGAIQSLEPDFAQAREALHFHGWRTKRQGTEWIHTCPECVEEGVK